MYLNPTPPLTGPQMSSYFLPVPDLYYDQHELPSPPSATSANMISTPPLDWQPHQWDYEKSEYYQPIWPETQWQQQQQQQQQQPQTLDPNSILFSSLYWQQPSGAPDSEPSAPQSGSSTAAAPAHSSSTPTPAPQVQEQPQGGLKLHQPRPSRRIPIVSLSHLALACDDFQTKPPSPVSAQVNQLPFRTAPSKPYHPMAYHSSNQFDTQGTHSKYDIYGMPFPCDPATFSHCSCGCMSQLYTFQ